MYIYIHIYIYSNQSNVLKSVQVWIEITSRRKGIGGGLKDMRNVKKNLCSNAVAPWNHAALPLNLLSHPEETKVHAVGCEICHWQPWQEDARHSDSAITWSHLASQSGSAPNPSWLVFILRDWSTTPAPPKMLCKLTFASCNSKLSDVVVCNQPPCLELGMVRVGNFCSSIKATRLAEKSAVEIMVEKFMISTFWVIRLGFMFWTVAKSGR